MKYTAGIKHTEKTVYKLTSVQYNTYNAKTKNTMIVIAFAACFGAAFAGFNSTLGILLLMVGCFTFTGIDYPAKSAAKNIIQQAKDNMPWAKYEFNEDGIWVTSGTGTWKVAYDEVFSLLQDSEYFYIFISTQGAHMVPKASIQDGTLDGFKDFLEEKTGKTFEKPGKKWSMMRKAPLQVALDKIKAKKAEADSEK